MVALCGIHEYLSFAGHYIDSVRVFSAHFICSSVWPPSDRIWDTTKIFSCTLGCRYHWWNCVYFQMARKVVPWQIWLHRQRPPNYASDVVSRVFLTNEDNSVFSRAIWEFCLLVKSTKVPIYLSLCNLALEHEKKHGIFKRGHEPLAYIKWTLDHAFCLNADACRQSFTKISKLFITSIFNNRANSVVWWPFFRFDCHAVSYAWLRLNNCLA